VQPDGGALDVDVVDVQSDRLGYPRPRPVEQFEQRAGAQAPDRLGLVGGRAGLETSSRTSPSEAAKRCSDRTETSIRATDAAASGGWSESPSRKAAANSAISPSPTASRLVTPKLARCSR
jgi:hypothetical protein